MAKQEKMSELTFLDALETQLQLVSDSKHDSAKQDRMMDVVRRMMYNRASTLGISKKRPV